MTVRIYKCGACGGKHAETEMTKLNGFAMVGTEKVAFVFQCPKTYEPVYVADVPAKKA
jgi:hypothetical protein